MKTERRTERLAIQFTPTERKRLKKLVRVKGVTESEFVRGLLPRGVMGRARA
jgi:hypothetical protein